MFYKFENGNWYTGKVIALSSSQTIDSENRDNNCGWVWHDEPPAEYVEWIKTQNND